ncbi:hypothetical protein SAMN05421858_2322 [Haladaptatus litoreus]|uniref:Uncharacterized protein n=1 Tax=Haladaptatus litoreus TaxID=553468 RepID=A0A1N7B433_9EURY|nr:hypothetical protein SAMN05421858_2322 [Haladaptatus litoreus]
MEQNEEPPEWGELLKHILTGLAVLSFVWVIRRLQEKQNG